MNALIDGCVDGRMDGWMDGWMDGCKWVSVMATDSRLFCILLIKLSLWLEIKI